MKKLYDVKKLEKHNLALKLKRAVLENRHRDVCDIATEIYQAGYELEDIGLLPAMFDVVGSILIQMKWSASK